MNVAEKMSIRQGKGEYKSGMMWSERWTEFLSGYRLALNTRHTYTFGPILLFLDLQPNKICT
jgi:hypothetical protein